MDIDLVYLWVNGNDPEWQKKRNQFANGGKHDSALDGKGRYADNDELLYSLRSAAMYAPWLRKIFIVTDRQIPEWLDTSNPKIQIVDHTEILPHEVLPTFNSTVIEHALHRIPDLSEHFLYANDDLFFNRPVKPSDFFTADGKPIARLNRRPLRKFTLWFKEKIQKKPLSVYNHTIRTSAEMVKARFGKYIGHKTHHNIDAYRRSDYRHAYELFRERIDRTLSNRVRSRDDVQRNLYTYVAMCEDKAEVQFVDQHTSFRLHIDKPERYAKLLKYNPMLFCLNDSEYSTDDDRRKVSEFLAERFPSPSPYEIKR